MGFSGSAWGVRSELGRNKAWWELGAGESLKKRTAVHQVQEEGKDWLCLQREQQIPRAWSVQSPFVLSLRTTEMGGGGGKGLARWVEVRSQRAWGAKL